MVDTTPQIAGSSSTQWEKASRDEILWTDFLDIEDVKPIVDDSTDSDTGMERTLSKLIEIVGSGDDVTGGDLDDDRYQAEVVGEEAVGGQNPTPDQNVTEGLLHSMGLDFADLEPVRTLEKLQQRDRLRWELDPDSSEDYQEHL
jgi:hypothetical protein